MIVSRRVAFPVKGWGPGRWKYRYGVDRYLAISDAVARVLIGSGVRPNRVTRVYSGIDPVRFRQLPKTQGLLSELGVPRRTKLVGFVGALVPNKAPGDILEAMGSLSEDIHAVLVGTGPLAADLLRQRDGLGFRDRVHFLGYRRDVPGLLPWFDVLCVPSRMEGLGTSVLDAMAAGIPVVGTRTGGIPEIIEDGKSGLLVPVGRPLELAKTLKRVLTDQSLSKALVHEGGKRVEDFSASRMVEKTLEVYHAVVSGPE